MKGMNTNMKEEMRNYWAERQREYIERLEAEMKHYKELAQLNIDKYLEIMQDKARLIEALKDMIHISCLSCPEDITEELQHKTCTQCCNYRYHNMLKEMEDKK